MKKINNKGFVLAETLIVTVFVMTIFTLLYVNFFPLLGEYAKREFYDDIDSKYDAYWLKRMIQNPTFMGNDKFTEKVDEITATHPYSIITCDDFEEDFKSVCNQYVDQIVATTTDDSGNKKQLITILLTNYPIGRQNDNSMRYLKNYMANENKKDSSNLDPELKDTSGTNFLEYIAYLPDYSLNPSKNGAQFRIIVEFTRKIDINSGSEQENLYYTYSTIEILRNL